MELHRLVTAAKLGDLAAFDALVRLCQRRAVAAARTVLRNDDEAEDVVQEAFLTAWRRLSELREPQSFPVWVASMARNEALMLCRKTRGKAACEEFDDQKWPASNPGPDEGPQWETLTVGLSVAQVALLELKYAAGLSHAQIGAVLGVSENRVKSRLFTLRSHLKRVWGKAPPEPRPYLEEKIMTKIETRQLGAHVFERLSLATQTKFAQAVLGSHELPVDVLADLGAIDRGTEFLALYGTRLGLGELVELLNHADRFTEKRLVEHLEVVDATSAEAIKQNMFVFEDIILCDQAAIRRITREADPGILAIALGGTELRVRTHVLDALEPETRQNLAPLIRSVEGDRHLVAGAQLTVVNLIKELEQTGQLLLLRATEAGGWPVFTVADRSEPRSR